MGKREHKRITIEADLASIGFKDLSILTGALTALEALGERGVVKFNVTAMNTPRRRRCDASTSLPPLQPQTQQIFDYLVSCNGKELSAKEIAETLRLSRDGLNGQLHLLLRRGLVECQKIDNSNVTVGPRRINVWKAKI